MLAHDQSLKSIAEMLGHRKLDSTLIPLKYPQPRRFYLYDDHEVHALMRQTRGLRPAQSLRPHTYATLIGLLAVTGLRIGEALGLDLSDWRPDDCLLLVRRGKFGKDRLLPLTDSTITALGTYVQRRQGLGLSASTDPLFLSRFGARLRYRTVAHTFRRLVDGAGLGSAWARSNALPRSCSCSRNRRSRDSHET